MAEGVKPRVKAPKSAAAGETVTLKTLISHKMESGQRKDKDGNPIPRSIINRFTCEFNGKSVIDVAMEPPEGAVLKDGWWVYAPRIAARPRLGLAASGATGQGWTLCTDEGCMELGAAAGEPVTLGPCGSDH